MSEEIVGISITLEVCHFNNYSVPMKYLVFVFLQLAFFAANSQDEEWESAIEPPTTIKSYSIYWYPSTEYWLKKFKSGRVIIKKVILDEGREKEIIMYSEGKFFSRQQNFYKDTVLSKSIIKYAGKKGEEVTYYSYGSITGELIPEKSYENGKLSYLRSTKYHGDTTVIETLMDSELFKGKERELIYYSDGGMTEHNILYLGHWEHPVYTTRRFSPTKQLLEKTRRHEDESSTEFYKYDSSGRLMEIVQTGGNIDVIKHSYNSQETRVEQYSIISPGDTILRAISIERFDKEGKLIYKEVKEYGKRVGKVYSKEEVAAPEPPVTPNTYITRYYYGNNGLIRVETSGNNVPYNAFEIKYD